MVVVNSKPIVTLEALFFSKSVTTALKVAEVRGVLLLLAQISELRPGYHYPHYEKATVKC